MSARSIIVLATVGALSCDAVLGIEALPRGTATFAYAAVDCAACIEAECAAEEQQCLEDDGCATLHECLAQCAPHEAGCRGDCEAASLFEIREPAARALDTCRRLLCTEVCIGHGGLLDHLPDTACSECIDEACVDQALECVRADAPRLNNPALVQAGYCERQLRCVSSEVDPNRLEECFLETPGHQDVAQNLGECGLDQCQCAFGTNFSCAGEYSWERALDSTNDYRIRLYDFVTGDSVPGVTVRACTAGSCLSCPFAADEATTDDDGVVDLSLSTGIGDADYCFRLEPPGYVPSLCMTGHPINRSGRFNEWWVVKSADFAAVLEAVGVTIGPDRGSAAVIVRDCTGNVAAGVQGSLLTDDNEIVRTYVSNGFYDLDATETDRTGAIVFLNVPEGDHTMVVTRDGAEVARLDMPVAAGSFTTSDIFPNTKP